jgi:hypothetical protein
MLIVSPLVNECRISDIGVYSCDIRTTVSSIRARMTSQDATFGRVDLKLDDLQPGVETEKWWPILDDKDQPVGEMLGGELNVV